MHIMGANCLLTARYGYTLPIDTSGGGTVIDGLSCMYITRTYGRCGDVNFVRM